MATPLAAEMLLKYAELQSALCRKMVADYRIKDDISAGFAIPKSGKLMLGQESWTFQRHGIGARMTRDSDACVVDAHDKVVSNPAALESWRLIDYFQSIQVSMLRIDQKNFRIRSAAGIDIVLEALAVKGVLSVIEGPRAYIFAQRQP